MKRALAAGLAIVAVQLTAPSVYAQVGFAVGVASGDVTDTSAVLWTRADLPANVQWELSTDPEFEQVISTGTVAAVAAEDLTVKVHLDGLEAATTYYYRFINQDQPDQLSRPGRFRTAPAPTSEAGFRFIFSGDSNRSLAPWWLMDFARDEQADFFLFSGDTIYGDMSYPGSPPATDLDGYRGKYRDAHGELRMQELLARVPIWCGWDDHEVTDNYDGGEPAPPLNAEQISQAYTAFFEYMPIRSQEVAGDEFRTYRRFRYGSLAEFFLLDGRQYRDAQVACPGQFDPYGLLIATKDQNCIDQLEAPHRTMLGAEQFQWLTTSLAQSTARYKFIINSVPLTSMILDTYDHWDSYDAERRALLEFIDTAGITGVYSLVSEVHANIYNPDLTTFFRRYRPGYRLSESLVLPEFIVGPIAAGTLRRNTAARLDQYVPAHTLLGQLLGTLGFDAVIERIGSLNDWAFIEADRFAYLVVDIGPDGPTFTYRGIHPDSPRPTLQNLYTVGPAGPPCMGFSLLVILPAAALVGMRTTRASGRGKRCGTASSPR